MAKKQFHIRLDADVAEMVKKVGKRHSRKPPREVNHVLREHYTTPLYPVVGIGPGDPMPPFTTVLDPTPRHSMEVAPTMPHKVNRMKMRG